MKKKVFSFLLIVSISTFAQGVERDSLQTIEPPLNFSTYFNPLRYLPDSYFGNELNSLNINTNFLNDSASILMQTRMQLARLSNQNPVDVKTNLLNPLYQNYMTSQNMGWFKQILGAVQVGAVGFLAYKHIEKYYIKKKK
ncbi:MAG: hypothetical protein Q8S39_03765 [Ignavibacteria bacterium]|nr:hypothetical protein [Ignavibacteria bacterium]